jgi:beta-glucosidase
MNQRIEELLAQLTFEEKLSLLAGYTDFTTRPIPRLGIPAFGMTDGPHGVGKHSGNNTKNTYFPAAIGLAATWNPDLAYRYGIALAQEVRAVGRHALLAPGLNICRTPLNGRTFEYLSEDPFLNSRLALRLVQGIQFQRIAACVKHFCCNNSEVARYFSNSIVDERTLEEIYFPAFKTAIQDGKALLIMGAYNQVNGKYVYENPALLAEKVCGEWGFEHAIISDWGATHALRDPALCLKAKLCLEMPKAIVYKKDALLRAFEQQQFSMAELDDCIRRLLRVMFAVGLFDPAEQIPPGSRNTPAHRDLARQIAEESFVLLKNTDGILPIDLSRVKTICLTGNLANYHFTLSLWGGSSAVVPPTYSTVQGALRQKLQGKVQFVKNPKNADLVIVVTGWTHRFFNDSEGQDRHSLALQPKLVRSILRVAEQNPHTVVVLFGGSACLMDPWLDQIAGLLCVWQPHQEGGNAIANILCGDVSPSGKLPLTFPRHLEDTPVHSPLHPPGRTYPALRYNYLQLIRYEWWWPNHPQKQVPKIDIHYDEGLYVGYRHYDKHQILPLFPFGFGLSYTNFTFGHLSVDIPEVSPEDVATLSVELTNTGPSAGAEVVQVYFHDVDAPLDRPDQALCGFQKILLEADETQLVQLPLPIKDLRYYNPQVHQWVLEPGAIELRVGAASRNIQLKTVIQVV